MKIKEILAYLATSLVAFLLTRQLITEFNPSDIISWLFAIPILVFDVLLILQLVRKAKDNRKDD